MTSTLSWGGSRGVRQKWDVIRRRGWGLASVLDVQFLFFLLLKKIGCAPWPGTKVPCHHASEQLMHYSLARNLSFDSDDVTKAIMIPSHCWCCIADMGYMPAWSIWMRHGFFLFDFVNLIHMWLFTYSSYANETGWLQND